MPFFNDKNDEINRKVLQNIFKDKEVIGLENSREILLGGGNIHCITNDQPKIYRK